ncbi:PstA family ABC transporter permease [Thalassoglobus polymorphus]|uniref:Phosphate transport system permease protein PstA n=1 Tax=Thalassoglobus polymorphus TaxID=2527994 RepID=A0A517QMQ2_9PLAN|nr:PstA family ABC transporter permease [Thalassoglobus polymorphus]QDT32912.1 Phosphate transport system permease protein PstA [Thalassoglobus polymorphus]
MSHLDNVHESNLAARHRLGRMFRIVCMLSTWFGVVVLSVLLIGVLWQGAGWLNWNFLHSFDSRHPEQAGILAGLWGSLWLILFTVLFSVPIGVGAALYLEEYAPNNVLTRLIQVNLSNLAGVPSIVYGILGLTVFVRMFGLFQGHSKVIEIPLAIVTLRIPLPLGNSVISAALTLSLLILPMVIVASQEALRAVPSSIRTASYALGATRWQTLRHQVLSASLPGILTGVILSISRAIGETAPLVMIGALTYIALTPGDITSPMDVVHNPQSIVDAPFDRFTSLPIQIFNWVSLPETEYQHVAAAGIIVLLVVLLVLNATAIIIRNRFQKRNRW